MAFQRKIKFRPAFDKRAPEPDKNYGIGCLIIEFGVIGDKGAVSFSFGTGIYTKAIREEFKNKGRDFEPMGYGVDYHSPIPIRDWQEEGEPSCSKCGWLDGKPCYSDGSSLYADEVMEILISDGEEKMWATLEEYYHDTFEANP